MVSPGKVSGGPRVALLFTLALAALPLAGRAHDERTMTRAQGLARSDELLRALEDPARETELRQGARTPGDLVLRIGRQPEVRELIHLRTFSVVPVLAALAREVHEDRKGDPRREVFTCTLVYVLDQSHFRGALPVLLDLLARPSAGHPPAGPSLAPYLPDVATQAVKSLSGQDGQDIDVMRFTPEERQKTVAAARSYLIRRAPEVLELVAGQAANYGWAGASSPGVFYEILAADPLVLELAHLCHRLEAPLAARLRQPRTDLARDYELAALSFAVERGGCKAAVPALIDLIAKDDGESLFAGHLATHALIVLAGQQDPNPRTLVYGEEERARIARQARGAGKTAPHPKPEGNPQ